MKSLIGYICIYSKLKKMRYRLSFALLVSILLQSFIVQGQDFEKSYSDYEYRFKIIEYNEQISKNPTDDKLYYNRGITKKKLGDSKGALADFTKAISLNGNFGLAYFQRGILHNERRLYKKAVADFTKAIKLNSTFWDAYEERGIAYFNIGMNEKACDDFRKSTEVMPLFSDGFELMKKYCN
jgi:tetratricopeptide (TPR) repeat protein